MQTSEEHSHLQTSPERAARRGGAASPHRLRCQRRSGSSRTATSRTATSSTSERRNERERNRVKLVNLGFAKLRQHVPQAQGPSKKLSKVETLRSAVEYIRALQSLLPDRQAGEDGQRGPSSDGLSPCASSCSGDSVPLSPASCSPCTSEESSREDSGVADADFFLTLHGWG